MVFTLISKKEKKTVCITLLLVDEKMMEDEKKLMFISIFIVGPESSNLPQLTLYCHIYPIL